jgi:hypothetical protein
MNAYPEFNFEAPTVPVAEDDGLIKLSDLSTNVSVQLHLWSGAQPRDTYQLVLNGTLLGEKKMLSEPTPIEGGKLELEIPIESLSEEGIYEVGYEVVGFPSGQASRSAITHIRIDRNAPGGSLLAPVIFPNISLETLKGKIPGYAGMEPGDVIETVCNGTKGPGYQVQEENLTTTPIEIFFPQEFLEGLYSARVNITYHVTDRAGNRSILAQSIELTMQR